MDIIFLDTTIQADKFLSDKEKKENIRRILNGKRAISSTYILGEFKSTFLKDATALYNLINDCEEVGDAVIRFERYYKSRIVSRMAKLFGNLLKECANDKQEILDRLEIYIEDMLVKRFFHSIDKVLIDNTKCIRSYAKPMKKDNVWTIDVSCRQNPQPKCNICSFLLKDKKVDLKKLTNLSDEQVKVRSVIKEIIKGDSLPYGNNCRTLGDTIIVLEAPDDSLIFTTNKKDFTPLCKILNKNLL